MYLSGARGSNASFIEGTDFTGYANNAFSAPDTDHLVYGGNATAKADMLDSDKLNLTVIDKCVSYAEMMGGGIQGNPQIQPVDLEGENTYLFQCNPYQAFDLRTDAGVNQWADIQKALMQSTGTKSEMIKGGLGMHNGVIIHKHKNVISFSDYGPAGDVAAARALFCGVQAGVIAFGSPGQDLRFGWHEEMEDAGNRIEIYTHTIVGIKKVTYGGKDFGVMAVDTAAKRP